MHKKQPGKPAKTRRTKEINYFAIISFVLSHRNLKDRWRVQRTFIPSRSTMQVQSPWKVHSDKRTEGRQISVFNIIDY